MIRLEWRKAESSRIAGAEIRDFTQMMTIIVADEFSVSWLIGCCSAIFHMLNQQCKQQHKTNTYSDKRGYARLIYYKPFSSWWKLFQSHFEDVTDGFDFSSVNLQGLLCTCSVHVDILYIIYIYILVLYLNLCISLTCDGQNHQKMCLLSGKTTCN